MLKFVVLKNPSACFRHGGGIGAHAPLDIVLILFYICIYLLYPPSLLSADAGIIGKYSGVVGERSSLKFSQSVSVTPAQITGRASRVNAGFRAGYLFLRYFKVLLMSTFKSIIY